ncbi:MAG: bifunctional ornithine acetyltransferase/N-acetylglutamate synthase, partial [Epulopiscium sp.]|nr:bifunctional ornithine acetyltransferase/N-acetylglutamate synthase [Candidatus Epulonipiscium sp.]NLM13898.1 bifunctional ornithine acetyltransferase/N-acetylglutamate synthase [Candidatus Epulonipiscium sp.]
VTIQFLSEAGSITVMKNGTPLGFDEDYAYKILHEKDIKVITLLEEGSEEATAWGCDLSYEYVRINGEYRT